MSDVPFDGLNPIVETAPTRIEKLLKELVTSMNSMSDFQKKTFNKLSGVHTLLSEKGESDKKDAIIKDKKEKDRDSLFYKYQQEALDKLTKVISTQELQLKSFKDDIEEKKKDRVLMDKLIDKLGDKDTMGKGKEISREYAENARKMANQNIGGNMLDVFTKDSPALQWLTGNYNKAPGSHANMYAQSQKDIHKNASGKFSDMIQNTEAKQLLSEEDYSKYQEFGSNLPGLRLGKNAQMRAYLDKKASRKRGRIGETSPKGEKPTLTHVDDLPKTPDINIDLSGRSGATPYKGNARDMDKTFKDPSAVDKLYSRPTSSTPSVGDVMAQAGTAPILWLGNKLDAFLMKITEAQQTNAQNTSSGGGAGKPSLLGDLASKGGGWGLAIAAGAGAALVVGEMNSEVNTKIANIGAKNEMDTNALTKKLIGKGTMAYEKVTGGFGDNIKYIDPATGESLERGTGDDNRQFLGDKALDRAKSQGKLATKQGDVPFTPEELKSYSGKDFFNMLMDKYGGATFHNGGEVKGNKGRNVPAFLQAGEHIWTEKNQESVSKNVQEVLKATYANKAESSGGNAELLVEFQKMNELMQQQLAELKRNTDITDKKELKVPEGTQPIQPPTRSFVSSY